MKLSTYIQKLKDKNVPESIAINNAKSVVKKIGDRWSKKKQLIFDSIYVDKTTPVQKKVSNPTNDHQLSLEKGIIKYKKLLKECGFTANMWGKFGLH